MVLAERSIIIEIIMKWKSSETNKKEKEGRSHIGVGFTVTLKGQVPQEMQDFKLNPALSTLIKFTCKTKPLLWTQCLAMNTVSTHVSLIQHCTHHKQGWKQGLAGGKKQHVHLVFILSLKKKEGKTKPTSTSRSFSHTDKNNTLSAWS